MTDCYVIDTIELPQCTQESHNVSLYIVPHRLGVSVYFVYIVAKL